MEQSFKLAMLDSRSKIDLDLPEPVLYEFENSEVFPSLSEWSQHEIKNDNYLFKGISLDNHKKMNVTVTMDSFNSGFKNMLGKYSVDDQGIIRNVSMLVQNTREAAAGTKYSFFQDGADGDLQFFLIANGHAYNKNLSQGDSQVGEYKFVVNLGTEHERLAKITDDPKTIDLVYDVADKAVKVEGNIFHTSNAQLNNDNKVHSISGIRDGDETTLRIGFEDFPNLGDRDFNDIVFDVSLSYLSKNHAQLQSLNDISPASGKGLDIDTDVDADENLHDSIYDLINNFSMRELELLFGSNSFEEYGFSLGSSPDFSIEYSQVLKDLNEIEERLEIDQYIEEFLDFTQGNHKQEVVGNKVSDSNLPNSTTVISDVNLLDLLNLDSIDHV